jgi:hypothetical protein
LSVCKAIAQKTVTIWLCDAAMLWMINARKKEIKTKEENTP